MEEVVQSQWSYLPGEEVQQGNYETYYVMFAYYCADFNYDAC